jgi:hypothetical protein
VLKTTYLRGSRLSESRLYFRLVWGMVAIGATILMVGFDQPLVLLVISACTGAVIMFVYSLLLIFLNRRALPAAIAVRSYRVAALVWSTVFFGALSVITIWQQLRNL